MRTHQKAISKTVTGDMLVGASTAEDFARPIGKIGSNDLISQFLHSETHTKLFLLPAPDADFGKLEPLIIRARIAALMSQFSSLECTYLRTMV